MINPSVAQLSAIKDSSQVRSEESVRLDVMQRVRLSCTGTQMLSLDVIGLP